MLIQKDIEGTDEQVWEDSLTILQRVYEFTLRGSIESYFYKINNVLIFDLKKELRPDIKKIVLTVFDSIFD